MLVVVASACGSQSTATQQSSSQSAVRDFVTAGYPHGVPYDGAIALGPAAVPELLHLLDDPAMKGDRGNIVATLGMIGGPDAVKRLKALIADGTTELPNDEVSLRTNAVFALGYCAYVPQPAPAAAWQIEALDYLKQGLVVGNWAFVKWTMPPNQRDPAPRLRLRAIAGLGLSGDKSALAALQALPPPAGGGRGGGPGGSQGGWSASQSEQASIDEAIKTNLYIHDHGMSQYYRQTFVVR